MNPIQVNWPLFPVYLFIDKQLMSHWSNNKIHKSPILHSVFQFYTFFVYQEPYSFSNIHWFKKLLNLSTSMIYILFIVHSPPLHLVIHHEYPKVTLLFPISSGYQKKQMLDSIYWSQKYLILSPSKICVFKGILSKTKIMLVFLS